MLSETINEKQKDKPRTNKPQEIIKHQKINE